MRYRYIDTEDRFEIRKHLAEVIAEAALQGITIRIPDEVDPKDVLDIVLKTVHAKDLAKKILDDAYQFTENAKIVNIVVDPTQYGILISLVLDSPIEPVSSQADLLNERGVFSYIYNVADPSNSEHGYVGFRTEIDGFVYRI